MPLAGPPGQRVTAAGYQKVIGKVVTEAASSPQLTAAIGVGANVAALVALGTSSTTRTLALMLGLAVGIDYALFIVSRYRQERNGRRGPRPPRAAVKVGSHDE